MPNLKFTIAIIKRHGGLGKTLKKIIRHENLSQIILKKFFRFGQKKYSDWILKYEVYNKEALKDFKKQLSSFNIQPLISIIFKIIPMQSS